MKVVFITACMGGGGTERVIANLANYINEGGHEVSILMTAGDEVAYRLNENIDVVAIGSQTQGSIWKRILRVLVLRRYIKKDKEQILLSFGTETNLFVILASLGLHNKLIVSERNDPNQCNYKKLRDFIYRFAPEFVFQTEAARDCFPVKIRNRSIVIPNPIKENLPEPYIGERNKTVVAVGRLNAQKNHKLLLESFADFSISNPEFRLSIFGIGELEEEIRKYAEKLNIVEKVSLPGFCTNVLEEIKSAYMYVLSSDYEGISNSLMEAMGVGLPVISTDCPIGGSAQLIRNEINGILVPTKDRKALTEAMLKLAKNPEFAQKIARNAIVVREIYETKKICQRWQEHISN